MVMVANKVEVGENVDWQCLPFTECIEKAKGRKQVKIQKTQYQDEGAYPVVDQGAKFIAGYVDQDEKLYQGDLPIIIFGDHTRIFKYVDFSFAIGADGTQIFRGKDFLSQKYFYYHLRSLNLQGKGYNRHFKYLKEKEIRFPNLPEQNKIATVLTELEQAISVQSKIIQKTKELKRSLMQKLFTEGLRREELKETEIGMIPKSWDVVSCASSFDKSNVSRKNQINASKIKIQGSIPVIDQGQAFIAGYTNEIDKVFKPNRPVIVFGDHTRAFKYVDFPFVVGADGTKVFYPKKDVFHPMFYYYALTNINLPSRGYNRHFKLLKEQKIVKPSLVEQGEIANVLQCVDKKTSTGYTRLAVLRELFQSMLYQLMTGQIRVKDFDIEVADE